MVDRSEIERRASGYAVCGARSSWGISAGASSLIITRVPASELERKERASRATASTSKMLAILHAAYATRHHRETRNCISMCKQNKLISPRRTDDIAQPRHNTHTQQEHKLEFRPKGCLIKRRSMTTPTTEITRSRCDKMNTDKSLQQRSENPVQKRATTFSQRSLFSTYEHTRPLEASVVFRLFRDSAPVRATLPLNTELDHRQFPSTHGTVSTSLALFI